MSKDGYGQDTQRYLQISSSKTCLQQNTSKNKQTQVDWKDLVKMGSIHKDKLDLTTPITCDKFSQTDRKKSLISRIITRCRPYFTNVEGASKEKTEIISLKASAGSIYENKISRAKKIFISSAKKIEHKRSPTLYSVITSPDSLEKTNVETPIIRITESNADRTHKETKPQTKSPILPEHVSQSTSSCATHAVPSTSGKKRSIYLTRLIIQDSDNSELFTPSSTRMLLNSAGRKTISAYKNGPKSARNVIQNPTRISVRHHVPYFDLESSNNSTCDQVSSGIFSDFDSRIDKSSSNDNENDDAHGGDPDQASSRGKEPSDEIYKRVHIQYPLFTAALKRNRERALREKEENDWKDMHKKCTRYIPFILNKNIDRDTNNDSGKDRVDQSSSNNDMNDNAHGGDPDQASHREKEASDELSERVHAQYPLFTAALKRNKERALREKKENIWKDLHEKWDMYRPCFPNKNIDGDTKDEETKEDRIKTDSSDDSFGAYSSFFPIHEV